MHPLGQKDKPRLSWATGESSIFPIISNQRPEVYLSLYRGPLWPNGTIPMHPLAVTTKGVKTLPFACPRVLEYDYRLASDVAACGSEVDT